MTSRRIYPQPPIVEAVLDFRFDAAVRHDALLVALSEGLGGRYAGEQKKQEKVEFAAAIQSDSVSTTAKRSHHLTFLQSEDGLRLLGCGDGVLSIHVLAPYPGWESFIDQADEAIGVLPAEVRKHPLLSIAVRYIDRIALPSFDTPFSDVLTIMPLRPECAPEMLSGFHVATQSVDPKDGTTALLTLASAPLDEGSGPAVIYDLNLQRIGSPLCTFEGDAWRAVVDALHVRQRDIFEASITDKARELFQ